MNLTDIENLLKANRILSSTLEIDKLLKVVLELAAEVVRAETGSLLILDEKTNELVFDVALGNAGQTLKTIRLKLGEGIAGWVAKENKPLIVNDPANDPRWTRRADDKTKFITRSILCVPMVHQGKILGVVQAINRKDSSGFSEEDRIVLEAFASQAGVALQNARLFSSLKQEKEKVETIFSEMSEGALLIEDKGNLLLCNPSGSRLLAINEEEKNNIWEIFKNFFLNPPLAQFIKSESNHITFEATRKEGKSLILSGLMKKIISEKKELIGYLTILRDVTLEKKEEKLKRDFLSLMSHKLKTPLVAITGYTPMLLEDEELPKLQPYFKKAIEAIHNQGIHLKQLVEKLILFSLIEAEELKLNKRQSEIKKIVLEVIAGMKTVLEEKKINLVLDESLDRIPMMPLDQEKFKEVIKCLMENAIKFNPKNEKNITLSGMINSLEICISIRDNGAGIPSEEFDKIFQKFYQIEESFTGQVEGAGLGLALVKRLIEVHGGRVEVESKMGEGSVFIIHCPILDSKNSK
ncbi:MAG: GAF domain-containing protein [Elusimicrobia bacterium]|nr:GAF domain-containing protein [Elusimicrobiota bacterium]